MRDQRLIIAGILAGILILGGGIVFLSGKGGAEAPQMVSLPTEPGQASPAANQQVAAEQDITPAATADSTDLGLPTPRAGLEATDPGIVDLSSGAVQLVEAFAYW